MAYRTYVYIAADWDGDRNLVDILQGWNESSRLDFSFPDAHELTQARDSSKECSVKRSLHSRLEKSKTFVLIVGEQTAELRKGSCQYCSSYTGWCRRGYPTSTKSYIEYECDYAVKNRLKIVVVYNMVSPDKRYCPEVLRDRGTHLSAWAYNPFSGEYQCDYQALKAAICY